METPPRSATLRWVRGDMHNHCERHELISSHLEGTDARLDFIALTNHGQKDVFFEQHEMVAEARRISPFPVLFGFEWNAAEGRHANVIFPPGPLEADHAYAFSKGHDRRINGARPEIGPALARLDAVPSDQRPILFFNHPIGDDWSAPIVDRYLAADTGGVVCGIEAVHGHQAMKVVESIDLERYAGCAMGGLADHVYRNGRPFSMLANSDFHIHKQGKGEDDYPLGVFNHTLVGIRDGTDLATAIIEGLRAGRTCAAQGHWLRFGEVLIAGGGVEATVGEHWEANEPGVLRLAFESVEAIRRVDVIGQLSGSQEVTILHSFGAKDAGPCELEFEIPTGSSGFVRIRVVSGSNERPPPGPRLPKLFLTSAILIGGTGRRNIHYRPSSPS